VDESGRKEAHDWLVLNGGRFGIYMAPEWSRWDGIVDALTDYVADAIRTAKQKSREETMDEFGVLHGEAARRMEAIINAPPRRIHNLIALFLDLPAPPADQTIVHTAGEPCNYPHCPDYKGKS
jgi:hypothetical protein